MPAAALAVGPRRGGLSRTSPEPTEAVDLASHTRGGFIRSLTGQLALDGPASTGRDGHATIDTPGTQGVVGFTHGEDPERSTDVEHPAPTRPTPPCW